MSGSCGAPALLDKEDGGEGKGGTSLMWHGWCLIHLGAGMVRMVAPSGTHSDVLHATQPLLGDLAHYPL